MCDIRILVCYHKECQILNPYTNDIYMKMHGGRKLYKGDNKFLLSLAGDDSGNNISDMNLIINELTVAYWGWKNPDIIGNPEYIGLNHYRRCFESSQISDYKDYDIILWNNILVKGKCGDITMRQQFEKYHGDRPIKNLYKYIDEKRPEYGFVKNHFDEKVFYPKNMFIMKRHVFSEYCEQLFPFILNMGEYYENNENFRDRSFIAERISSIIFETLSRKYKTKFLDIPYQYI